MKRLEGKRAVVTGAGSGIGRATAVAMAGEGASVIAVDYDGAAAEACAQEIRQAQGECVAQQADVTDEQRVIDGVELCVEQYGRIDIYYANAGIGGDLQPLTSVSRESMVEVLSVNLIAPMLAIKHAAPRMVAQGGGAIICTASVAALGANGAPVVYSASKAGVVSLVKGAAQELADTNVRVNAVSPGLIETGMTKFMFEAARSRGVADKIGQLNPLRRPGDPAEIAAAVVFLASAESSYINGQAIVVDGGLTSSLPYAPSNALRVPG